MSNIPVDTYTPAVLETSSLSKAYTYLKSLDLCIYVSTTNELRVTQIGFNDIQVLDTGAAWVSVVNLTDYLDIYYCKLDGYVYHIRYNHFMYTDFIIDKINLVGLTGVLRLDSIYYSGKYCLIVDNNIIHRLYTSSDPLISTGLRIYKAYNNQLNPTYLVTCPRIDFHPSNIGTLLSVAVKMKNLSTLVTSVGVYVIDLLEG